MTNLNNGIVKRKKKTGSTSRVRITRENATFLLVMSLSFVLI